MASIIYYFAAEYNGWMSFFYFVIGLSASLVCGYLQTYIIYNVMGPLRRSMYEEFGLDREVRGLSLRSRIFALAALFVLVPLVLAWGTAALTSLFETRDDYRDWTANNVAQVARQLEASPEDYPEIIQGALTPLPDDLMLLQDAGWNTVYEYSQGQGVDAEEVPALLEELQAGSSTAVSRRMDLVAASAPVSGTEYTLVEVVPLASTTSNMAIIFGLFALLGVLFAGLGGLLTKLTSDTFTVPLFELEKAAEQVAGGDLTVHVQVSAADEVGLLTGSFKQMVDGLHGMSTKSLQAAEETSEGATGVSATTEEFQASLEQLTGVIENLAHNASSESRMADRVYALIGEIHAALESSSSQADQGAEVSRTSSELAEQGKKDALAAVERMGSVRESINQTAGVIGQLEEQISEIGVIVEVIDNIADQTNLLSLNAAIEAARAQEHGRGFQVVAEEVKKLAEESARSTQRIAGLVRDIQRNTSVAVQATERGTMEVDAGVKAVQVAGGSLEEIYDHVKQAEELSRQVAETTREHLGLIEQGIGAMEDIRNIAEQNASSSEEIAAAAEEQAASMQELAATSQQLASLAEHLKEIASAYRLQ